MTESHKQNYEKQNRTYTNRNRPCSQRLRTGLPLQQRIHRPQRRIPPRSLPDQSQQQSVGQLEYPRELQPVHRATRHASSAGALRSVRRLASELQQKVGCLCCLAVSQKVSDWRLALRELIFSLVYVFSLQVCYKILTCPPPASQDRARIVFDCPDDAQSSRNALAIGIQFSYDSSTIPMRFFRELDPFASHVAVAALAIATWAFLIVPLWRRWRPKVAVLSKNNLLKKRLAAATIVLLVFAVGLWTGWHKDAISARLSRWHSELTRTIPSPSPSPSPLVLTESSVDATAQTPAPNSCILAVAGRSVEARRHRAARSG